MKNNFKSILFSVLFLNSISLLSGKSRQTNLPKVYQGRIKSIVKTSNETKLSSVTKFTFSEESGWLTKIKENLADGSSKEVFYKRNVANFITKDSSIVKSKSSSQTFINSYTIDNDRISSVKSLSMADGKTKEYKYKYGLNNKLEKIGLWQSLGANLIETGKATYTWQSENVTVYFENIDGSTFEEYQLQYSTDDAPEYNSRNLKEFGFQFKPEYFSKNVPNGMLTKYRNERFKIAVEKDEKGKIIKKIVSKLSNGNYELYESIIYNYY